MQAGNIIRVRIPSTSLNFALAHGGAAQTVEVDLPEAIGAGRHCRARIREIRLWATTQIKYGLQFYGRSLQIGGATIDLETYLGEWSFTNSGIPGDGTKATGDTFFYWYVNGLDIAYQNFMAEPATATPTVAGTPSKKLFMRVVNWDAALDKAAAGNLVIELGMEPLQGI